MSLVLVATSLASWAPRFSYGFSSSISLATVTPSLVIVGAPHFLSMTTLRPRGPSVTFTVSASLSTPRSRWRRASSSNSRILGIDLPQPTVGSGAVLGPGCRRRAPGGPFLRAARGHARTLELLLDDREHVAGREHQVLLARVLHFGAAVLAVQHHVVDLDVDGDASALVVEPTRTDREELALLGLLLRGVRDDQPGRSDLLSLERLDHDAVFERLDYNLGGGRHDLTSPSGNVMESWHAMATRPSLPSRGSDLPRRISTLHQ